MNDPLNQNKTKRFTKSPAGKRYKAFHFVSGFLATVAGNPIYQLVEYFLSYYDIEPDASLCVLIKTVWQEVDSTYFLNSRILLDLLLQGLKYA